VSADAVTIGGVIALVSGAAGAIYTTRNRTELKATQGASVAWREERDAAVAHAERLEKELRDESRRRSTAEARTDISALTAQIALNHRDIIAVLDQIAKAMMSFTGQTAE
jgi:predicted secreted Zn-dependent protease